MDEATVNNPNAHEGEKVDPGRALLGKPEQEKAPKLRTTPPKPTTYNRLFKYAFLCWLSSLRQLVRATLVIS